MEDSLAYNLTICALYIIVPAVTIGAIIWGTMRMTRAAKAEISDDECVSCGSRSLERLGEGAYRCVECGYEGGSGLKKMHEDAHVRAIEAMNPGEKRRSGVRDLADARSLLLASHGTLESALKLSRVDMVGLGGADRGQAKQRELTSAVSDIARAQALIRDASLKLGDAEVQGAFDLDVDFTAPEFGLDIALDNVVVDFMVHGKIKEILAQAKSMHDAVDGLLTKLASAPSPEA